MMRNWKRIAVLALCALLPATMAPTGGIPSILKVQKITGSRAFSSGQDPAFVNANTLPIYSLRETDGGADAKNWWIQANGGQFAIGAADDALNTQNLAFSVQRSGTSIAANNSISIGGVTYVRPIWVKFNGNAGCGISSQSGANAFTSCTRTGTGQYTLGVSANGYDTSANWMCTGSGNNSGSLVTIGYNTSPAQVFVRVWGVVAAAFADDGLVSVSCMGR